MLRRATGPLTLPLGLVILAISLLIQPSTTRAEGPDDDYLTISGMVDDADSLLAAGHTAEAQSKYLQAREYLDTFRRDNPDWNPMTVKLRLRQLTEKADQTLPGAAAPVSPTITNVLHAPAVPSASTSPTQSASPVHLTSNGSEPRQLLRFHPSVGDQQQLAMTLQMSTALTMQGTAHPAADLPALDLLWSVKVTAIETNGDIDYQMRIQQVTIQTNSSLPPTALKTVQPILDQMTGATGNGQLSPSGLLRSFDFHLPKGKSGLLDQSLEQVKDSFRNSFQVLPEEPVGLGARWSLQTRTQSGGLTIDQTITSQLDSVDGDHVSLSLNLAQSAGPQRINNPSTPGVSLNLQKFSGSGHGNNELDLSHLSPTRSTLEENVDTVMSLNSGPSNQTVESQTHLQATLVAR